MTQASYQTVGRTFAVTGFGCAPEAWRDLLAPFLGAEVLSFYDQLTGARDPGDLRSLGSWVGDVIGEKRPDLLIAHDFGVITLALGLRRVRQEDPTYSPRLIFFNSVLGAGVDLFQVTHPVKIQFLGWPQVCGWIARAGGEADPRLARFFPQIKAIYRQVVLAAVAARLRRFWPGQAALRSRDQSRGELAAGGGATAGAGGAPAPASLPAGALIIVSSNDPFLPAPLVRKMAEFLPGSRIVEVEYGHFPYSVPAARFAAHFAEYLPEPKNAPGASKY